MKKLLFLLIGAAFCLSSCLCDKHIVGNINPDDELVHVKSVRNAHFFGLLVNKESVKSSIGDKKDYVLENKTTFWDGFVSGATFGIYTPTTTKYYLKKSDPDVVVIKKKLGSKAYKGYLKN